MSRVGYNLLDPVIPLAMEVAVKWGYPRELNFHDRMASWWAFGPSLDDWQALVWAMPIWGLPVQVRWLSIHAVKDPGAPAVGLEDGMMAIMDGANAMGAERVYGLLVRGTGSSTPVEFMRGYLAERGWKSDDLGMYLELEG